MSTAHLILSCADSAFALPIERVIEVLQMVAPSVSLPRAPRYCLGAIDYHGRLVPLIDLGARLGLCAPHHIDTLRDARIVLVEEQAGGRSELLGYMVDEVVELTDRPTSPLSSDGHRLGGLVTGALRWQEGQSALVLDLRKNGLVPLLAGEHLRRALAELSERAGGAAGEAKP